MEKGLVSVVIPIYKVEKYLERCLQSVTSQTYTNLQIILVNDGSPDRCPQICDEWAEKDSRITVIHKDNHGLGEARNSGLEKATGEYICFFDSDDYIERETIAHAYSLAKKEQADLVIYGWKSIDAQGNVVGQEIPTPTKAVYVGAEVQKVFLPEVIAENPTTGKSFHIVLSAWRVFFSMDLIRRTKWRFVSEKEIVSEDVYSLLELYRDVQKVAILYEALYCYCTNENSVSRAYRKDRYEKNRIFYLKCLELCEKQEYTNEVKRRCKVPFLSNTIAAMKQIVAHFSCYKRALPELQKIIDDDVLQQVLDEKKKDAENIKKKLFYWMVRHRCYVLCYFLLKSKLSR